MPASLSPRVRVGFAKAGRVIVGSLIVLTSLFAFPSTIPWLIAAWLLAYTLLVIRGRNGSLCLAGCLGILIVKRPTPAPTLLVLMAVMVAILVLGLWRWRGQAPAVPRRFAWFSAIALWTAWLGMAVDWHAAAHCSHRMVLKPDRPVVCFGDSMTSVGIFGGYPRDLQKLISLPVVNAGIGGISARQTAENHLSELTRLNPQLVVIELGGHDFLRGHSRAATKAHLKTIIDSVRRIGAEVVLLEIPRAYVSDPYWGLEREVARQEDVELVSDTVMRRIFLRSTTFPPGSWLGEPYLTDESGIHPNQRGNQLLAERVAVALERLYGPGIRHRRDSFERQNSL